MSSVYCIGRAAILVFNHVYESICATTRRTLDICFCPVAPLGVRQIVGHDGFVIQKNNWHAMIIHRPFADPAGTRDFLLHRTEQMRHLGRRGGYGYSPGISPVGHDEGAGLDAEQERENYHS